MAEQPALGFAGLLRQLRAEARQTPEELAMAAGLSLRSVSDLERGIDRTPSEDTAALLGGALGLAEPVRALFVAAACGRIPAAEVLAAAIASSSGVRRASARNCRSNPANPSAGCSAMVPASPPQAFTQSTATRRGRKDLRQHYPGPATCTISR